MEVFPHVNVRRIISVLLQIYHVWRGRYNLRMVTKPRKKGAAKGGTERDPNEMRTRWRTRSESPLYCIYIYICKSWNMLIVCIHEFPNSTHKFPFRNPAVPSLSGSDLSNRSSFVYINLTGAREKKTLYIYRYIHVYIYIHMGILYVYI